MPSLPPPRRRCAECGNVSEGDLCPVRGDDERDATTIAVSRSRGTSSPRARAEFGGRYHVMGALNPADGTRSGTPAIGALTSASAG